MEDKLIQLFLQIINMSITAGYVILAVLVIRLLLKKAPKKYSYALWSVVAFRLCCPVSFQSIFSIFSLKLFDMSKAQSESGATLQYVPGNIGMMAQPEVTVGIPYANSMISGSLPAATPMYSANPMQIWTAIGMYLWCLGIVVLVLYSIISCLTVHYRMRDAIILEDNVYQSDRVRSPFMLGIIHPKIYIPFGLDAQTYRYVLTHERYHLKRRDHMIKLLAFLLLTIHWFNPLCWLAFTLMSRDMEMSCDEKVLSGADNIRKAYSTTLLSFAANRRFPAPSPLAFGETGVKKRIKNVLNWKKPALWITVFAIILCGAVLIACAANPVTEDGEGTSSSEKPGESGMEEANIDKAVNEADLFITYVSVDCLYMSPLSSYMPVNGDSGYYYLVNDNSFYIASKSNGEIVSGTSLMDWEWQPLPYTEEEWSKLFDFGLGGGISLDGYEEQLYLEMPDSYSLLKMDDELWVMRTGAHPNGEKFVWNVYVIEPLEESSSQAEEMTSQTASQETSVPGTVIRWPITQEVGVLEFIEFASEEQRLETAIHNAILEHNKNSYIVSAATCEDHAIIATQEYERYNEELSQTVESVDIYAMVLYEEYSYKNSGLETVVGGHGPVVMSFDKDGTGEYVLTNYWQPRDGSYYVEDIKKVFGVVSPEAVDNGLDTQKYIMEQKQRCYAQAVVALNMDVDAVIEGLLEDVISFPPWASAPQGYIAEGTIAYRELLYYGDYTLQYIEKELAEGEQTDLRGQCMEILKQELEEMKSVDE